MRNKNRMLLGLAMAGVLSVQMLLTGCGGPSNSGTDEPKEGPVVGAGETQTAETKEDTASADTQTQPAADDPYTDADREFGWVIFGSVQSEYYSDYDENPGVNYWLEKEWDADGDGVGHQISIDFEWPAEGGEQNYMNTLIATGEYPEVIALAYASDSALTMYENGILIDITDYVEKYMPNYMAWLDEHPTYKSQVTVDIGGERRFVSLYCVADTAEDAWGGYMYRRDWIVKYGKDKDGKAFTGGWNADKSEWTDNVVFPSGNEDPVYISDWEWMMDIFKTALEEEGIEDGYCFQLPYSGFCMTGDFASGFGGGIGYAGYYFDEDGQVQYGLAQENCRAYLECMAKWYANGWIDPHFEERTSDTMWFNIDAPGVYGGKVGCFYGTLGSLLNNMDTQEGGYTDDICVYMAAQPINDVYGSSDCQNKEPMQFYETSLISAPVGFTNKAESKDLPSLFTAIDYLYSVEGGLLRYRGFSNEQMEEVKDKDYAQLYYKYGLQDGVYEVLHDDSDYKYRLNKTALDAHDGLSVAVNMVRLSGTSIMLDMDTGNSEQYQHMIDQANMYDSSGSLGTLGDQIDPELATRKSEVDNQVSTYVSQAFGDFVTGRQDITDDAVWDSYVSEIEGFGPLQITEALNEAAGN